MNTATRKKTIEAFVREMAARMVEYAIPEFGLPSDWEPIIKISFSSKRRFPRGGRQTTTGKPWVSLPLYCFLPMDDRVHIMYEYDHYKHDSVFGGISNGSWKIVVAAILAHELAHAIDWTHEVNIYERFAHYPNRGKNKERGGGHGRVFQYVYRRLRMKCVNNYEFPEIAVDPVDDTAPKNTRKTRFICKRRQNHNGWKMLVTYYHSETKELLGFVATTHYSEFRLYDKDGKPVLNLEAFDSGVEARNRLLQEVGILPKVSDF